MAEVKDKIITVGSLAALHTYDENTFLKKNGALSTLGVTATTAELNHVKGTTSNIQTQLDNKHTSGHNVVVEQTSTPNVTLSVKNTNYGTKLYKNANEATNDFGTTICDYDANGERDALVIRRNTSLERKLLLKVQDVNGTQSQDDSNILENHYYIYGEHHKPTPDEIGALDASKVDEATCTLASGWTQYASDGKIYANRYGKIVTVTGSLKNTVVLTSSSEKVKMFTIPSGYRPAHSVNFVCHGVGVDTWQLTIGVDGIAYISRYGATEYKNVAANGGYFAFTATYVANN